MVRLFVRHKVGHYSKWRKAYDDFDSTRKAMGVLGSAVFQSVDDPKDVTVWHDFATKRKAKALASSSQLRAKMCEVGVRGVPQIWIATEIP
jgi:hypothetical protein